jgi:hypothetical protein
MLQSAATACTTQCSANQCRATTIKSPTIAMSSENAIRATLHHRKTYTTRKCQHRYTPPRKPSTSHVYHTTHPTSPSFQVLSRKRASGQLPRPDAASSEMRTQQQSEPQPSCHNVPYPQHHYRNTMYILHSIGSLRVQATSALLTPQVV